MDMPRPLFDPDFEEHIPLSARELVALRHEAESQLDFLLRRYGHISELQYLDQACSSLARCLQVGCMHLRDARIDRYDKQQIRQALEFQVAYLRAQLQRAIDHL